MVSTVTEIADSAPMKSLETLCFDNRYASLPAIFHSTHTPHALENARLLHFNSRAAALIDLDPDEAKRKDFVDLVTGANPLPGYQPIACCYAGHQFGHFVPRLGDGRAILLGEVLNDDGSRWDLHLKGAGLTLYSREGDGRAVLRSSIREYLCSEAMHGLGISTTQALCLTGSDERVYRERVESGATVLRMAPSHIRFGTFEYFYYTQRYDDLRTLADFTLETHFPHLLNAERPYLAFLTEVIESTAKLMSQWQAVGFMHGVMNTDNMSVHGLTIDYGPFGFMETFNPAEICNHSDHTGRYAYNRQPEIALFNLSCLAQAMVSLFDSEPEKSAELATAELHKYQERYIEHYAAAMRAKLGLQTARDEDQELCSTLLSAMAQHRVDFTRFFRALSCADAEQRTADTRELFSNPKAADAWLRDYNARLNHEPQDHVARAIGMRRVNPKFVLRNYIAEVAIRKAEDEQDFSEIDRLMSLLATPYDEHPEMEHYAGAPPDWATQLSVSCSS
ncbi:MAG: YdiU family protein [Pseudomonadota bacterium]